LILYHAITLKPKQATAGDFRLDLPLPSILQAMYLVLVTNKNSNILEDLETLRMLGKVVADVVMPMEEEYVAAAAFDLIFTFDEVVSLGGHKENVTAMQVRQNTEMESHEEKLHKMIVQSKINETKDLMKKKAIEIEKSKIEGMRSGAGRVGAGISTYGTPSGGGGMGRSDGASSMPSFGGPAVASATSAPSGPSAGRKGMQLGKSKLGRRDFIESLKAEGETVEDIASGAAAVATAHPPPSEPIFLTVEEKLSVALNKDGGLEGMEVVGSMSMTASPEAQACVRVKLAGAPSAGYQFKTHPNIDKALFSEQNVLGLKDASRPFPTGAPLGVLKWRYQTADESEVPLTINCWPSVSGGQSYVNIEYDSNPEFDLHNVQIAVPLPATGAAPAVNSCDGDWRYDARQSAWIWTIELVDSGNSSGSAEFVVPAADPASFFPISVSFTAPRTLCDLKVDTVVGAEDGQPVKFGTSKGLSTESYIVE
jgi:coatomer subunit delta